MEVKRDMLGNIVRPGDLVVSSAMRYRSAELRVGVVEKVNPGDIVVMRVTESYNWKAKKQVHNFRRYTTSATSVIVIRWNCLNEDNQYYEVLQKLKEKVMKA